MFIVLTKSNCVSCQKTITFLESEGEMYKEYNLEHSSLSEENLKLLLSTKGRSLLNFIRDKAKYFTDNNINPKTLSEDELARIVRIHLKDIGSFPIILQLNYSGRVKNCMVGFDELTLKKWIEHQELFNYLINVNKAFGLDECCWLCKKQKIIEKIKGSEGHNAQKTNNNQIINNLMNLKKMNDSLVGKEQEVESQSNYIPDNEWLKDKYSKAREEILENDEKMKESYDFFSMNNTNQSFMEQLQDERQQAIEESNTQELENQFIQEEPVNEPTENVEIVSDENFEQPVETIINEVQEEPQVEEPIIKHVIEPIIEPIIEPAIEEQQFVQEQSNNSQDDDLIMPSVNNEESNVQVEQEQPIPVVKPVEDSIEKEQDYKFTEHSEYEEEINIDPDLDEPIVFRRVEGKGLVQEGGQPQEEQPQEVKQELQEEKPEEKDEISLEINKAVYQDTIDTEPIHHYRQEDEDDEFIMPSHKLASDDTIKDNSNADYIIPDNDMNNFDGTVHEEIIENEPEENFINIDWTDEENPINDLEKQTPRKPISIDLSDPNNKLPVDDITIMSEQNAHLRSNATVIDEYDEWVEKYRLSEQEINHQKAMENEK